MRIISYNVNGIRAAIRKGLLTWLAGNPADVICLQEVKAMETEVDAAAITNAGYPYQYWFSAEKKGYSGVAIFSKIKPQEVYYGSGDAQSDAEGRVIQADFPGFRLVNAYFPSGTSGAERQAYKYQWLDSFGAFLHQLQQQQPALVLVGDYNIAHAEVDIHDPKGNKNSSGFLPEERAWMTAFLQSGWVDTFRHLHQTPHCYTWWSQRFPSVRLNNKGWRIDYACITTALQSRLKAAEIYPDVQHSDHCPVFVSLQ